MITQREQDTIRKYYGQKWDLRRSTSALFTSAMSCGCEFTFSVLARGPREACWEAIFLAEFRDVFVLRVGSARFQMSRIPATAISAVSSILLVTAFFCEQAVGFQNIRWNEVRKWSYTGIMRRMSSWSMEVSPTSINRTHDAHTRSFNAKRQSAPKRTLVELTALWSALVEPKRKCIVWIPNFRIVVCLSGSGRQKNIKNQPSWGSENWSDPAAYLTIPTNTVCEYFWWYECRAWPNWSI